jgi:sugar phosphate isomerase/epimerase
MAKNTFRVGVTLYSFTTEYYSYTWSFDECMRKAAELGPGMGVEIVGPEHHRDFPDVPREFETTFKNACQRYNLVPTSYGAYADPFFWHDRDLTDDDLVEYTIPQLKGAARLGFPVVRAQYFIYKVIERLLPYAEKYKLKIGYEVHTPIMFETPTGQELIQHVKKISSPHLGLIPDCSIFEKVAPGTVGPEGEVPPPSDPATMKDLAPYIIHVHGKFHQMIKGEIPAIPYDGVVKALVEGGFKGWMSTEFEGGDLGEYANSLEVVKAHHVLVKRLIAKYAKG